MAYETRGCFDCDHQEVCVIKEDLRKFLREHETYIGGSACYEPWFAHLFNSCSVRRASLTEEEFKNTPRYRGIER